jgi:DNA-binding winged helix-turn-helix (wHTH) protein
MPSDARHPIEPQGATGRWRVGDVSLDLDLGTVTRHARTTALRRKTLLVLRVLLFEDGRPVSRDVLLNAVWPGVWVVDDSLTQCIRELRAALGPIGGRHLVTLRGRGYLIRDAEREGLEAAPAGHDAEDRLARLEARLAALEALLHTPTRRRRAAPEPRRLTN